MHEGLKVSFEYSIQGSEGHSCSFQRSCLVMRWSVLLHYNGLRLLPRHEGQRLANALRNLCGSLTAVDCSIDEGPE